MDPRNPIRPAAVPPRPAPVIIDLTMDSDDEAQPTAPAPPAAPKRPAPVVIDPSLMIDLTLSEDQAPAVPPATSAPKRPAPVGIDPSLIAAGLVERFQMETTQRLPSGVLDDSKDSNDSDTQPKRQRQAQEECCVCSNEFDFFPKMYPCEHSATCYDCATRLTNCPLCRARIQALGGYGGPMHVIVKNMIGEHYRIDCDCMDTVERLMEEICDRIGIPPDQQRLVFVGKQLDRARRLTEYNIQRSSIIHLVQRLRGD